MTLLTNTASSLCMAVALTLTMTTVVSAKTCFKKAGVGEAISKKGAQFQVDEVLLQATDWGLWMAWMATGSTPGYSFGKRHYTCSKEGIWGWKCHGHARICKL